jgi:excisionase family DNA binding protein
MRNRTAADAEIDACTLDTFARRHGISLSHVYKLINEGRGPQLMRLGARVLVTREAAEKWRRQQEERTAQAAEK